jgi:hypothetical protein
MAIEHKLTQTLIVGAEARTTTKTYSTDADSKLTQEISIADSITDQLNNLAITVASVKSIYLCSNKALTLKTNSSGAPDDTLNLVADVPYVWNTDSYDSLLLTVDVTAFYLTNASGAAAILTVEVIEDATP